MHHLHMEDMPAQPGVVACRISLSPTSNGSLKCVRWVWNSLPCLQARDCAISCNQGYRNRSSKPAQNVLPKGTSEGTFRGIHPSVDEFGTVRWPTQEVIARFFA